jgi:hypothetical protein
MVFDLLTKYRIYQLADAYQKTLRRMYHLGEEKLIAMTTTNEHPDLLQALRNLLPGKDPSTKDLQRMASAQFAFARKLYAGNLFKNYPWNLALVDLQLFFNLGLPYYDTNFNPNLQVDFMWHALMQDPALYRQVCRKSIGELVPHCVEARTEQDDIDRYNYFVELFGYRFGRKPHIHAVLGPPTKTFAQLADETTCEMEKLAAKERAANEERQKADIAWREAAIARREAAEKADIVRREALEMEKKEADKFCKWNITIWEKLQYYRAHKKTGLKGCALERYVREEKEKEEKKVRYGSSC